MAEILMSFERLAAVLGGRLVSFNPSIRGFSSVCIDSRKAGPGALFVALAGSVRNGHDYVEAAFRAGAAAALVAESRLEPALEDTARRAGALLLTAADTLQALQQAAAAYLSGFPGLVRVGITGSSGKTTTKEIAAAMIGAEKEVVINPGNYNSETGLPLAVFGVRSRHQVGIFEMGMNRRGEIGALAAVLRPHIALITNIGSAHIGIIGSREGIAQEKKAVFSAFTGTGLALIPEDDEYRDFLARDLRGRPVFYGPRSCGELGSIRELGLEGTELNWEGRPLRFGLPGAHNIKNALAAAAIAKAVPVGAAAIRRGLESVKPLFGRGEILRGSVTVVQDCYNANPESAAAAIRFCDAVFWPGRRIYIIGSMLELGTVSPEAHRELGRLLAVSRADMVFLYGTETAPARDMLEAPPPDYSGLGAEAEVSGCVSSCRGRKVPCFYTGSIDVLSQAAADFVRPGDLVLLKGSRGCALERLAGRLLASAELPVQGGV
ncbi:MAG: UDP-N-acetylmuramoyl-tripeptide--D-alanyl-D-alanine ligase [Treponema sp.]|jgi:UDP-N-acetylmuramoyl-tripeptide--D-alanyl-D-alanine ligase|nr:UDP-N-acetylmuramoyl-tripeptide--D-alanyl-D-alanine ligase [Treponema sp.]